METVLRELSEPELPDLLRLYQYLHPTDDALPESHELAKRWQAILRNPDLFYCGLFVSESLAATCALAIIPNLTRGCRPYGLIENVVTDPAHRRRGFGKAVLRHALAEAWERGCYKVMLLTGRKDESTYRFYESAGFDRHAKQAFLAVPPKDS